MAQPIVAQLEAARKRCPVCKAGRLAIGPATISELYAPGDLVRDADIPRRERLGVCAACDRCDYCIEVPS